MSSMSQKVFEQTEKEIEMFDIKMNRGEYGNFSHQRRKLTYDIDFNDALHIIPMLISIYEGDQFTTCIEWFKIRRVYEHIDCLIDGISSKELFSHSALIIRENSKSMIKPNPLYEEIQSIHALMNIDPSIFLLASEGHMGEAFSYSALKDSRITTLDSEKLNAHKPVGNDINPRIGDDNYHRWRLKYISRFCEALIDHMNERQTRKITYTELGRLLVEFATANIQDILAFRVNYCPYETGKTRESIEESIRKLEKNIKTRKMPIPPSNVSE